MYMTPCSESLHAINDHESAFTVSPLQIKLYQTISTRGTKEYKNKGVICCFLYALRMKTQSVIMSFVVAGLPDIELAGRTWSVKMLGDRNRVRLPRDYSR